MAITPVNSEDRLVQATFAKHLQHAAGLGQRLCLEPGDVSGLDGTLGRADAKAGGADPRPASRARNASIPTCRTPPSRTRCGQ